MKKVNSDNIAEWSVREEIGIITLNNPPENYLETPEFIALEIVKKLVGTNPVKGLIICGTGRHFSAGANPDLLLQQAKDGIDFKEKIQRGLKLLSYVEDLDIPVVSAIRGVCFGGGLEIALSAHIRICSRNALFAFPESNHGLIPGLGGISKSSNSSGFFSTLVMTLSGDVVNAEEALEMHLIDKISEGDPFEEAFSLLTKMTSGKPIKVINSVMKSLKNVKTLSMNEALQEETRLFCELASDEALRLKILDQENK